MLGAQMVFHPNAGMTVASRLFAKASTRESTTDHRLAIRRSCEQMFLRWHWREMMAAYKRQLRRSSARSG